MDMVMGMEFLEKNRIKQKLVVEGGFRIAEWVIKISMKTI